MANESLGHAYRGPKMTTIRVYNAVYADRALLAKTLAALPTDLPTGKGNALWFDGNGKSTGDTAPAPAVVGIPRRRGRKAPHITPERLAAALKQALGL